MRTSAFSISCRQYATRAARPTVALAVAVLLAACGGKSNTPSTQVAAKVGKGEVSVHQINFNLRRQGELPPAQQANAQREVLERLIDQEVMIQKAQEQKLDRDPQVMQALEAARREVIARAYIDRLAANVAKPAPEELKQYRESHPLLFAQRRIYDLQEINARATPEQAASIGSKLSAARSVDEINSVLRAASLTPDVRQSSAAPENMPQALVERISALQPNQPLLLNMNGGIKIIFVTASRPAPLDEASSLPRIEAFLLSERKRQAVEQDIKSLRAALNIEYTGPFAGASAPAGASTGAASAAAPALAPAASQPAKAASSGGGIDDATINRGFR